MFGRAFPHRRRAVARTGVAVSLGLASALVLSAWSSATASPRHTAKTTTTLQVWLGGTLTTSTPGTTYRTWVNDVISSFEAKYKGTNVDITLLPANNDELAAKVEAAFTSHSVPDLMFLYSGAYTTVYEQGLLHLNKLVNSTPGFYKSISAWNLSCENLNCKNGSGTIIGVPADLEAFFLYYNKKLFAKAGLKGAPVTWSGLLNDCKVLRAKKILPMSYGDLEGYTTVNFWDELLSSYITQAQMNSILAGHMKLTASPLVKALETVEQLRTAGCSQSDASTVDQLAALNPFAAGKSAMVEMVPALLDQFESGIGASNLGVSVIPGTGPLGTHVASNSADDWVIPAQSAHPSLAWDFIKVAMDSSSAKEFVKEVAYPPTNIAAGRQLSDPLLRFMAAKVDNQSNLEEFDSVLPNGVALYLYKELNLFFAGRTTAEDVLSATQSQLSSSLAQSSG